MEHLMEEVKNLRELRKSISSAIGYALAVPSLSDSDIVDRLTAIAVELRDRSNEIDKRIVGAWLSSDTTPH